ncbi:MAG: hypothetical protein R3C19_09825 [Planctomycetaceae bacterium]
MLISQVVSPKHREDAAVAQQALKVPVPGWLDREACAAELSAAVDKSSSIATKVALLEVLGAVGGTNSLAAMDAAGKSSDAKLQDISTRLLGEWMTEDAAPSALVCRRLRRTSTRCGLCAATFASPDSSFCRKISERQMCEQALAAALRPEKRSWCWTRCALSEARKDAEGCVDAMKVPELKDQATETALAIAQKVAGDGVDVSKLLAEGGFDKVRLEIVKAEYGAGDATKDVTELLQKQARICL